MSKRIYRIGQIVPSSNITMETEIPAMLRARETVEPERFTFHSSRMRMKRVTKEELKAMDGDSVRCALELSDARVDALVYACLVAIMSMGKGYHRQSEARLHDASVENGAPAPVVTQRRCTRRWVENAGSEEDFSHRTLCLFADQAGLRLHRGGRLPNCGQHLAGNSG